ISGEIVLPKLVHRLLEVAMEEGSAQKGCLLLARDGDLRIEIEAQLEDGRIETTILPSLPAVGSSLVPEFVVRHVRHNGLCVILRDAGDPAGAGRFSSDEYLARTRPRSVMCLPIVRRAEAIGLLYLENNLVAGAFTAGRLAALELLAAQAAISLE